MDDHFGNDKTIKLLKQRYFWQSLKTNVNKYIWGCEAFQKGKEGHQSIGLYMPLLAKYDLGIYLNGFHDGITMNNKKKIWNYGCSW